jgi:hypothetical protein
MSHATPSPRPRPVEPLRRAPQLPFAQLLGADTIAQALRDERVSFRDRLFSPFATLWVFLSQVLDPDHSCRAGVARFCAWRAAQHLPPCSADTSAYCQARGRLPEGVLSRLTRLTGRRVHGGMPAPWLWGGHPLKVVDGTTASMPDTPANQREYPQPNSQKPGLGFPLVRMVVLFSLTVGTVLDAALGRYAGKRAGETALFHTLQDNLEDGDILLADRYYSSYWEVAFVRQRGAAMVCRLHQRRRADFHRGRRLGADDHVVTWPKPAPRLDGRGDVRGAAGGAGDARGARAGGDPRLPDQGAGGGDDAAGPGGDAAVGRGAVVPAPLVRGVGPAGAEAGAADGRAARADAGEGAQGDLGAPAGVQPDPRADGGGGARRVCTRCS